MSALFPKPISRRELLKTACRKGAAGLSLGALGALLPASVRAAPYDERDDLDKYDFLLPRVRFNCDRPVPDKWNAHAIGDIHLLEDFSKVIRCKVKIPPGDNSDLLGPCKPSDFNAVVDLGDIEQMRKYPFLFMMADGSYHLNEQERANVKEYVNEGGFMLLDDCVLESVGDFFYWGSYRVLGEIFGQESLKRIPNDHEVFCNVFDLTEIGLPYLQGRFHPPLGIFIEDRLALFLSSTDIHCGWVDRDRTWFPLNEKIGRHTYKEAIQMGINLIMYALSH
ncbi:MAG: DUF4159 domain-containing protein [Planctomycetes bacterium]|nr:DUF4159 domain-containing protein [Planctomycetota bacterium]